MTETRPGLVERRKPAPAGDAAFKWPEDRRRTGTPPSTPPQPERGSSRAALAKSALLVVGLVASLALFLAPPITGLSAQGKAASAVFLLSTTLWVTHVVPFGVTGLLAIALLGLSQAVRPNEAFAAFGNSAVFFLIGVFVLAGALVESGLSKRCALLFLRRFEGSPYGFTLGMMLAAAFGTLWMPNQATTAMLFPIALEVVLALRLQARASGYATTLFLALAWGAIVGSNASVLGSTRAALALGMLTETHGRSISYAQWIGATIPMVVLGLIAIPPLLRTLFPREVVDFTAARRLLEAGVADMGPVSRQQWTVGAVATLTIAAWVTLGARVDLAVISLLGATALFATRAVTWEQAERRIYWNIVLMYGGAIALGVALDRSGAARWVVEAAVGQLAIPPFLLIAVVVIAAVLLSEFMSNAAAVAVLLPLAFTVGERLGVSPTALTLATSIGAGLDFALPYSSAPNTIVFASGYLRMRDMVKGGLVMTAASVVIVLAVVRFWWPVLGLY